MFNNKTRIACGLKFFWLNWLNWSSQMRVMKMFSRAGSLRKTLSFVSAINNFRSVLLILPEKPYELLLTQKCIIALKEHRRDMRIDVVAEAANKDIIRSNPYIDGGFFYTAGTFLYSHPSFKDLVSSVKGKTYDACFLMNKNGNPLNFYLVAQSQAPLRVGFSGQGLSPFINLEISPRPDALYEGDLYESLFGTIGIKMGRSELRWNISKSSEKDAEGFLAEAGYRTEQPLIGVDFSSSLYQKLLPPDIIQQLVDGLASIGNAEILLFNAKNSDTFGGVKLPEKCILLEEHALPFSAAFVHKCGCVVTLNNLTYQLAVLVNRPVVGLFETEEHQRWGRVEENMSELVIGRKLRMIGVAEVLDKTKRLLAKPAKAGSN